MIDKPESLFDMSPEEFGQLVLQNISTLEERTQKSTQAVEEDFKNSPYSHVLEFTKASSP